MSSTLTPSPSLLTQTATPRGAFLAGFRAVAPIFLGTIPFGLVTGVTSVTAGLTAVEAIAMSTIVFAGASQLAALQLLSTGGSLLVIWFTTVVINLRHVMYSASIAPYLQHLPLRWRALLAFLMTDQGYAFSLMHYETEPDAPHREWYFLGVGLPLLVVWVVATAVGVFLGAQIPSSWGLDFVIPLVFLVMLFPNLKNRPAVVAALSAGLMAVIAKPLPYNLGLVLAAIGGIVAGLLAEFIWPVRHENHENKAETHD
jgi:4-azaleucine resistance transporter AzlC